MKKLFFMLVMLHVFLGISAQHKGIKLVKMRNNRSVFLPENQRIKIKTTAGERITGKFTIVNDSVIMIKGETIALDSIQKIRRASTYRAIAKPVSLLVGSALFVVGGVNLFSRAGHGGESNAPRISDSAAGAFGVALSTPFLLLPITKRNHPKEKWKYEIVNQ